MVSVWNNLECDIINFDNLRKFKLSLMKCDLSKYVNYWLDHCSSWYLCVFSL